MSKARRVVICFSLLAAFAVAARAQTTPADGAQQFARFGDFRLQSGAVVHDFRLGYRTLGKLNPAKSNAILWPTFLGGKSEDLLPYLGPGKVINTTNYFVILVDSIGNGVSSSPSNSTSQPRMRFPEFTIRDMVESEHKLVTEILHLSHLRAVIGVSMGGMQTFEWATAYPGFMDLALPLAGSPQSTSYDKLLWNAEMDALKLDPEWKGGNGTAPMTQGFALYNEIASMNFTSPAYRVTQTNPEQFDAFREQIRKDTVGNAAAVCDAIRQRQAINALDIPGEFHLTLEQSAKRVRARMFVFVTPQDHMVNPAPAIAFANAIGAPIVTIDSPCGHLSLSCVSVGPVVAKSLADSAQVRTMTLHDTSK